MTKLKLYGSKTCSKCLMSKKILNNKSIDFEYILIETLEEKEKESLLLQAKECGQSNLPIIFENDKIISFEEACNVL